MDKRPQKYKGKRHDRDDKYKVKRTLSIFWNNR